MSRNGSGVYTPPGADFPAVGGTLIESTKFNNVINDIATGMTTSLASDGQTTPTANLPMGGFKLTGLGNGTASTDAVNYAQAQAFAYRNHIINGGMRVAQRSALTLGSSAPAANAGYGSVDMWQAWATGTAVSAGTATQDTAASVGTSGYALKLSGVTLTGTGVVYIRYRMEAKDAVAFKNKSASFAIQCYHDVGSAINYTVTINKPTVADNFAATTNISSGVVAVSSATATEVALLNVSMGDCSKGIEIEVKAACGAITTKNFWFAEALFNTGSVLNLFQYEDFVNTFTACKRYYEINTGNYVSMGMCYSTTAGYTGIRFSVEKRTTPTCTFSGTFYTGHSTNYSGTSIAQLSAQGFEGYTSSGTFTAGEALEVYSSFTAAANL